MKECARKWWDKMRAGDSAYGLCNVSAAQVSPLWQRVCNHPHHSGCVPRERCQKLSDSPTPSTQLGRDRGHCHRHARCRHEARGGREAEEDKT